MKTKIFLLLITFLLINFVAAQSFCVDFDKPKWPESTNLNLTIFGNDIQLQWDNAIDIPDCSGIDYYTIWGSTNGIDFLLIANILDTTYTDTSLSYGNTYYYMIHVFDLAGHNEGEEALSNSLYLSPPSEPTPPGGGGRSSSYWECGEWSKCINETQTRTCEDVSRVQQADRIETRDCVPEFVPLGEGEEETLITEEAPAGFFATITGAVVGALGTGGTIVVSVFVIAIVALAIVFSVRGRKK